MTPLRLLVLVLSAFCALPAARAHFPGESSLVLSTDEENLAVLVSLSLLSATALLPADAQPISSATLDELRPALLAAAERVCVLQDASGAALAPQRVLVSLFDEHELRLHFLFAGDARPARLRMPLLSALGSQAFCSASDLRSKTPVRFVLTSASPEVPLASPAP